jgi:hypothetical protein
MPERTATEGAAAVLREWRALLVTAAVIGLPFFQWHAFLAHRTMSSFVLPLFVTVATIVIFGGLIGRRSVAPVPPPKGIGGRAVGTASRGDRRVRWTIAISGTAVLFVLPADRLGMVLLVRGIFLDGWALLFAARGAALIRDYRFRRGAHAGLW